MAKYVKKIDEVQAVQWNGVHSLVEIDKMLGGDWTFTVSASEKKLKIHTNSDSGPLYIDASDYVVLEGDKLRVVPMDLFKKNYQEVPTTLNFQYERDGWKSIPPLTAPWAMPTPITSSVTGDSLSTKSKIYSNITGVGTVTAKFECDDCLDVSKDTKTFAQKTACHCCDGEV